MLTMTQLRYYTKDAQINDNDNDASNHDHDNNASNNADNKKYADE